MTRADYKPRSKSRPGVRHYEDAARIDVAEEAISELME